MVDSQDNPVEQCTVQRLGHGVSGSDGLKTRVKRSADSQRTEMKRRQTEQQGTSSNS